MVRELQPLKPVDMVWECLKFLWILLLNETNNKSKDVRARLRKIVFE
jgi:hypothetical protein